MAQKKCNLFELLGFAFLAKDCFPVVSSQLVTIMKTRYLLLIASLIGGPAVAAPTPAPTSRNPEMLIRQNRERIKHYNEAAHFLDKEGMKGPAIKLRHQAKQMELQMKIRIRKHHEHQAANHRRLQAKDTKPAHPQIRNKARGKPGAPKATCPKATGKTRDKARQEHRPTRGNVSDRRIKSPVSPELLRRSAQFEKQLKQVNQRLERLERTLRASQAKKNNDVKSAPKSDKKKRKSKADPKEKNNKKEKDKRKGKQKDRLNQ